MTQRWTSFTSLCAVSLALATCDGSGEPDSGLDVAAEARRRAVVSHAGEEASADVSAFVDVAATLETATAAHAAGGTTDTLAAARDAWIAAMNVWQRIEVVTMGPGAMMTFSGGMAIRDDIYAFPLVVPCQIDQLTAAGAPTAESLATRNVNVRGLGTIEYLLFTPTTENTCPSGSPINVDGTWAALGDAEIDERRADYAAAAAVLVHQRAIALREAWATFLPQLTSAGEGSAPLFNSAQQALSELSGALLYTDTMTKEMKIGEPAGIIVCTAGPGCLIELESRWSARSKENILLNLRAFERVFLGAAPGEEGLGYDDLLADVGQRALADQVSTAITAAITSVEALEGTLEEAITTDPAGVMAAFDAIAALMRLFKVDVFNVLDIQVSVVPTDND
jgi:predicted lipoprotein